MIESSEDPDGYFTFALKDARIPEDFYESDYKLTREIYPALLRYTDNEILYHLRQCEMAGLIGEIFPHAGGFLYSIADITPIGHEFLADIRSDTNWTKTKDIAQKVGSTSLSTPLQDCREVIASIIKSQIYF